jgi:DNA mismatch endonuclease, patch repair protein
MEDAAVRRRTMQAVRSANTNPELIVRRLAHKLGYRYRLHRKELPGKPDLAFVGRRKVVFVHGCFWHGHNCARGARTPMGNRDYWVAKIARNRTRDKTHTIALTALGWKSLVIWECELKELTRVRERLATFLDGPDGEQ